MRTVSFASTKMANMFAKGAMGLTRAGGGHVIIAPSAAKPAGEKQTKEATAAGWFVKEGIGKSALEYTLTHEFGHTLDTRNGEGRRADTQTALNTIGAQSTYGRSDQAGTGARTNSGKEAYAESFAAWHLSGGTTMDPLAVALAESEGWK